VRILGVEYCCERAKVVIFEVTRPIKSKKNKVLHIISWIFCIFAAEIMSFAHSSFSERKEYDKESRQKRH
jgi:hypothetical protein